MSHPQAQPDYRISWSDDPMSGRPCARFVAGESRWLVRFYDGFGFPDEDSLENAVEAQFEELNTDHKNGAKFTATGGKTGAQALAVFRACAKVLEQAWERMPEVEHIGFRAEDGSEARIAVYDMLCKRLEGRKVAGEEADLDSETYAVRRGGPMPAPVVPCGPRG